MIGGLKFLAGGRNYEIDINGNIKCIDSNAVFLEDKCVCKENYFTNGTGNFGIYYCVPKSDLDIVLDDHLVNVTDKVNMLKNDINVDA